MIAGTQIRKAGDVNAILFTTAAIAALGGRGRTGPEGNRTGHRRPYQLAEPCGFQGSPWGDWKGRNSPSSGRGLGPDQALFASLLPYFNQATGAVANYSGSDSFEQQIVIDSEAGSPPRHCGLSAAGAGPPIWPARVT